MAIPSPTPQLTQSLAPHELDAHRGQIGVEVQIVLSGYWQSQHDADMAAAILADWMDELEDWHIDQVRWALRHWRKLNPSKRPNPGHISQILKGKRGQAHVSESKGEPTDKMFAIGRPLMLTAAE